MRSAVFRCLTGLFASLALTGGLARAEFKVGIAGPLSGSVLNVGEQQEIGALKAIEHLNLNGGVLGEEIVTTSVDDACKPEQAKAAARQLVSEGVVFVVGHVCSGASIAVSGIYEEAGIVMISAASTNPKVTEAGHQNVFRVIGRDDQQGLIGGDYLADNYADSKVGIMHDGRAYGRGLAEFTKDQLNKRGVTEALFDMYEPDLSDYTPIVGKLVDAQIDVLYAAGYQGDLGIILRQARRDLPNLQFLSGDSLVNGEFLVIAGDAGVGARFTFGPDIRLRSEAAEVVEAIREEEAYEPDGYTLYAYGAVQAWAQAAEQAGSMKTENVIAALKSGTFDTVLGKVGFDEKGDVTGISSFVWYEFGEEDYTPID